MFFGSQGFSDYFQRFQFRGRALNNQFFYRGSCNQTEALQNERHTKVLLSHTMFQFQKNKFSMALFREKII